MTDKWVLQLEKQDEQGAVICGPFCFDLHCSDGGGSGGACVSCTTLLCSNLAAFTLPDGVSVQTFAFPGVMPGDVLFLSAPSLPAGVSITTVTVSVADQVQVTFNNTTGIPQTVVGQTFSAVVTRACK
jgi:hypothetical protein